MDAATYRSIVGALSAAILNEHPDSDMDDIAFYVDREEEDRYIWTYAIGREKWEASYFFKTKEITIEKVGEI